MENPDSLPFFVQVDDTDEPGDVLDSLALAPFVAGRHPYARTRRLSRVRAEVTFVPREASSFRTARGSWRSVVLSEGPGWMLKAERWQDDSARLTVTAIDERVAEAVLDEVCTDVTVPPEPAEQATSVGFWHSSGVGAKRSVRSIEIAPWVSIRRNYSAQVAVALDELMGLEPAKLTGRLLLLHGPPGTGKTSIVRAISHEWREWCTTDCVLDPEVFLHSATYLASVLLGDDDDEEDPDRWRLLILEDCDEVIRSEAKAGAGQGLSRLLNLTDGLLGQGRNILICITTNEDFRRFHPAVVRPGRCLRQIEVGPLNAEEAAAWLGVERSAWTRPATLATLYAAQAGNPAPPASGQDPPIGQYL